MKDKRHQMLMVAADAKRRSAREHEYRREEKVAIDLVKLKRRTLEMRIVAERQIEICDEIAEALDTGKLKGSG